jgi:SAM-dependent methyltransferase
MEESLLMAGARPAAEAGADRDAASCPACGGLGLNMFHRIRNAPANSCILLATEQEARAYPTGDIELTHCETCGFVFNRTFDAAKTEYSARYEETQACSATFNRFHRQLAERLIERHRLRGRRALEIGCGKGEFLELLAELGDVDCLGIDPGVHVDRIRPALRRKVTALAEFFSPHHLADEFTLIACKMTIEHLARPFELVSAIRQGLAPGRETAVFFMAPEATRVLTTGAVEDVYYEHCNYFTAGSLSRLFRRAGFDVEALDVVYDGQYLTLEARAPHRSGLARLPAEDDLEAIRAAVATFPARAEATTRRWRERLLAVRAAGQTVVIWGSGSKAVAFLTAVGVDGAVSHVVDINPRRHHFFMPGTAQAIVPPSALADIRPDLVIVMNRIYVDEIRAELQNMDLHPAIAAL